jgi:hypothetical protein
MRHRLPLPVRMLGSWVRIPLSVCIYSVCVVLRVGRDLATGWSPVQEVLPTVCRIKKLKKRPRSTKRSVEPLIIIIIIIIIIAVHKLRNFLLRVLHVPCIFYNACRLRDDMTDEALEPGVSKLSLSHNKISEDPEQSQTSILSLIKAKV